MAINKSKQTQALKRLGRWLSKLVSTALMLAAISVLLAVVPVFGNRALIVRSGSMEPAVGVGDLVIVRPNASGYKKGDIIAFKSGGKKDVVVTHRIVDMAQTEEGVIFTTKGDANNQPDINQVKPEYIIGRQIFNVPYLGRLLAFGKTKSGYLTFILVPGLLVILSEAAVIFREIWRSRRAPAPAVRHCEPRAMRGAWQSQRHIRIPIDSITRKFIISATRNVMAVAIVAIMIPSTFALYADSEISTNNIFQAGCWTPPTVPVHIYPPDGTVAGAGSHWITNPYLDWEDSTAPCGGVLKYQYQSAHNDNFDPVLYSSGLLSISQIPASSTPDGVYFWRARAFDGQNYSDWSGSWKLTVDRSLGQANHIVISEVQRRGINSTDDFAELYNPTDEPVDLTNWKIRVRSSTGSENSLISIAGGVIPAHGYFLWASTDNGFAASIGADVSNGNNLAGDNSVQLRMPDDTPVDSIAWGSGANQFVEGSAFAVNPEAGQSLERKAVSDSSATDMASGGADETRGNSFDSDDNSFDFILRTESNPQNSSSGTEAL